MRAAPIGVVVHDCACDTALLLGRFAARLRAAGVDVGGLCQVNGEGEGGHGHCLVDIRTGERYRISQELGAEAAACSLDPGGFAAASVVLRREIAHGAALLVVNKFAWLESAGQGLLPEMFEAIASGIPVLTSLSPRHKAAWDAATDGAGTVLTASDGALWEWWEQIA